MCRSIHNCLWQYTGPHTNKTEAVDSVFVHNIKLVTKLFRAHYLSFKQGWQMVLIMKNRQKPVSDKESNYLMQVHTQRPIGLQLEEMDKPRDEMWSSSRKAGFCSVAGWIVLKVRPETDDVVKQKHLSTSTYIMKRGRWYMSTGESFIADEAITEMKPGSAFLTGPCQHFLRGSIFTEQK